jgi:hypothetical protein
VGEINFIAIRHDCGNHMNIASRPGNFRLYEGRHDSGPEPVDRIETKIRSFKSDQNGIQIRIPVLTPGPYPNLTFVLTSVVHTLAFALDVLPQCRFGVLSIDLWLEIET